jgi:hypothetical protein
MLGTQRSGIESSASDGDRTGGVLTSPVRSGDFEGLTGAPAWSNCARSAIIVIGLSEQQGWDWRLG